jgi:hypothetical protein
MLNVFFFQVTVGLGVGLSQENTGSDLPSLPPGKQLNLPLNYDHKSFICDLVF